VTAVSSHPAAADFLQNLTSEQSRDTFGAAGFCAIETGC
jgi:hypothetical protein